MPVLDVVEEVFAAVADCVVRLAVRSYLQVTGYVYGATITDMAPPVWAGASKRPYTHSLGMKVADKLSPLTPQPSPMGQGAVGWALGAILCWSPGARSFGTTRR